MSVVLSFAGMQPSKAWASPRSRHDDNQLRTAKRSTRQKCLPLSCACATANYSVGFLANAGCARAPSLCDPENVHRANVQIMARPPTANEQSCNRQIARLLPRKLRESSGLHDL